MARCAQLATRVASRSLKMRKSFYPEKVMGYLTVISETGFPHSVCLFEYHHQSEWYAFKPKIPKFPLCPGYIDRSNRTPYIKHLVKFEIPDSHLEQTIPQILSKYRKLTYCIGKGPDCVTLSVDVAQWCGLTLPQPPNLIPGHLVSNLAKLNPRLVQEYY
ncbi:hypothetical protein PMG71_17970 [Roseofilum sp. BLCC_M154]|uniref:Uncharacterized protein n=1 Tax=Roseofilum acuticapitatum BLCC-M154 TaxID=3022444 RepID=A0ABT7AWS7_9CYAN|nr:hypothetical protein [Roseofilum acuticapitatum]MDJ1171320.1 hypothetical protein [Roseofilum acuticapitatum BLCC-M154]